MPQKNLDQKLERIRGGDYSPADFIIADAKDGDMGGGAASPGLARDAAGKTGGRMLTALDYRRGMADMVAAAPVDIMLTSLSANEVLTAEGVFADSAVTPAIRMNEATDIWGFRGASYRESPAVPIRTARVDRARALCDLGLYAVTFYNNPEWDVDTLEHYAAFRDEAAAAGLRHFLEVFNPAIEVDTGDADMGTFINDCIVRCLAGIARSERPEFLKIQYNGARAMEELAAYDPGNLIVGILGGGAGTTGDTFELVRQAERHGARVALFGRKIHQTEDPPEIVRFMRRVVEGALKPSEAVRAYHDHLDKAGLTPWRTLDDDSAVTDPVLKDEAS
ncbi:MAG: hypothetical protein O2873_08850 [Proteobacteria bacterium]|nr:hypothetical protein [Pseudomonadota bacterium]